MFVLRKRYFVLLGIFIVIAVGFVSVYAKSKQIQSPPDRCRAVILSNEEFFPVLLESIDEAQNEIMMSIFSFKAGEHKNSYPDRIAGHLAGAVKRGVKVTVVLETTRDKSDDLNIQNRKTGRLLEEKGVRVLFDSPGKTTHTKLTVIDQSLVLLGSHNFTQSALKYNNEISILLKDPGLARDARNYILSLVQERK